MLEIINPKRSSVGCNVSMGWIERYKSSVPLQPIHEQHHHANPKLNPAFIEYFFIKANSMSLHHIPVHRIAINSNAQANESRLLDVTQNYDLGTQK